MYELKENENYIPKALLAGVDCQDSKDFEHSIDEMKGLIRACDMEVVGILTQVLEHPDNATYMGKGKVAELKEFIEDTQADYCVFEADLSPSQMKNLQKELKVPVWDRTNLILEIFSRRARTKEAKLQVETAYLQFMLPRLSGMWQHLDRQNGGKSGGAAGSSRSNKGVGESQLELDRRQINHRLAELRKDLDDVSRTRDVQRSGRKKGEIPSVALVGYTNAGKSSLMNRLLEDHSENAQKQVFEKNMLFATLDTSIRKITTADKKEFLLSDTVGFIEKLPTTLVKAFRSTLDEVKYADLLLIVLDASDPYVNAQKEVTESTLKELEINDIPVIYVMNKADLVESRQNQPAKVSENKVFISAKSGQGIDELLEMIYDILFSGSEVMELLVPFNRGDFLNRLHKYAEVINEEYLEDGTKVTANCPKRMIEEAKSYLV